MKAKYVQYVLGAGAAVVLATVEITGLTPDQKVWAAFAAGAICPSVVTIAEGVRGVIKWVKEQQAG